MTAWAKALNACQTADLLENRNSDRPSHSPAHIGPGADVGDRQIKLLSCIIFASHQAVFRDLTEFQSIELRSVFVCRCFRISGAQPRTGKCRPPSQPKRLLCVGDAGGRRVRGSASSLVCSQTQVSGLPRRDGPDSYKARGLCKSRAKDKRVRGNAKHERQAHSSQNPSTQTPFQCPPTKPFQCPPTRRGGLSLR
jgi:hypothetical protein